MANKHTKRCSILLVIRELQIKTMTSYHFTHIRIARIKKITCNKCQWGYEETGFPYIAGGNAQCCCAKTDWQFLSRLNIELLYDPAVSRLGIYPKELKNRCSNENVFINVCSSTIRNSQKKEKTQMSIKRSMDKQIVVHPYVLSHSVMSNALQLQRLQPTRLLCPWESPGKNTGVCCHALLQGIMKYYWATLPW